MMVHLAVFTVLFTLPAVLSAFSAHQTQNNNISVRFSLYPNVANEIPPSMKQAVKAAVGQLGDLGVQIRPDDVSSCLIGSESALFEALRSCFARACLTADGKPRGISMQATIESSLANDYSELELPVRTAVIDDDMEFVRDAYLQPPRIAAQFALYPMGTSSYMRTIQIVQNNAKQFSCWKHDLGKVSAMLDGDGNEVFDVLRESLALARNDSENVAMTFTLTANKNAWPVEDRSQELR